MAQSNSNHPPLPNHQSPFSSLVAGVDIGGTNLRIALADRTGSIVARQSQSCAGISDPHEIVRLTCEAIDTLLRQNVSTRADLAAIAAGAPGVTDTEQGIVLATSYLLGWRNLPLRSLLQDALGVPAFVDNDVNMAAFGEARAGVAQGTNNFVFLAIGTGVGAGIVLNGELFRGEAWTAGEIGYMLVPGVSVAPAGHGNPGALEEIVGGQGIQSHWQSLWSKNKTSLSREVTATQIFDQALNKDPLACEVLSLTAHTLAYAIYNMALVLNCPLFVLGGTVGLHPALGDATRSILQERNAHVQPRLIPSALGADAQLMGAIFRAIEVAKTHTPTLAHPSESIVESV